MNAREVALRDIKKSTKMDIRNDYYGILDHYTVGVSRLNTKENRRLNKQLGI